MRGPSSLNNRIFLACTLLATLSLGLAFAFVNARATAEGEAELRRGLVDAAAVVDERRTTLTDTFTRMARLVADLSNLKAAVGTGDPPTVQPLADDYRQTMNADLLVVSDPGGKVLGEAGADATPLPADALAAAGEHSAFVSHPRGVLQLVSVPIYLVQPAEILGRLTVGFFLDDRLAAQFKRLTGSDIAFAAGGRILASSLPTESRPALASLIGATSVTSVTLKSGEYLALARPIVHTAGAAASPGADIPVVLILRSRTERLRFLNTLRTGLGGALLVTVILATLLSFAVARTMTRPLAAVTRAMRDVAATGDLTRRVRLRSRPWDDGDARLLAAAFNTLTESIARFQQEAAQKERLSSLGRLSTVVAHEIRNPLMIIRATLSSLRRDNISQTDVRDAVADIDEETRRLNRVVTEVLDFAKPIRLELAETSLNEVCRVSAAAASAGESRPAVTLDLDPGIPSIVTDAERLRTALVNILTNARHAVQEAGTRRPGPLEPGPLERAQQDAAGAARATGSDPGALQSVAVLSEPGVIVRTGYHRQDVFVTVEDRGTGISEEDMAHIFDPYFTTRRAGTGLGLPISKNIVERLGGTIAVSSRIGEGTLIRITLPLAAPETSA